VRSPSFWRRTREVALQAPPERNRYVDFLRALSICAVVVGHWLVTAPWYVSGGLLIQDLLAVRPWTQWLTLLFQVMPVFFFVGGYSNAASWDSARRRGGRYGEWLNGRLRRLVGPVIPLLVVWLGLARAAGQAGVSVARVHEVSRLALVPIWFLAVYILVILLVPLTRKAWLRFGYASFWLVAAAIVVVDGFRFWGGHHPVYGWLNYLFVWVAVHQLGYAWRDGRIGGVGRALLWATGGAAVWALLARFGPYPISMVSVAGAEISNTLPPDIMLLALGTAQWGLLMAIEEPMQRWLARPAPWTATVLVNGTIMSLFLWHVTALVLLMGLSQALGGTGLGLEPGTGWWWASRPLWLGALGALLVPVLALFGRFERVRGPEAGRTLPVWRTLPGALLVCFALAVVAFDGIVPAEGGTIRFGTVLAAVIGALLLEALPLRRSRRDHVL
jgi:hypothetical protein